MYTVAVAPPGVGIAIGIGTAIAGVFWIFVGLSRAAWAADFRSKWRYGKGPNRPPVTRTGFCMLGLSWLLGGSAIAAMVASGSDNCPAWPMLVGFFGPLVALAIIGLIRGGRPVA